MQNTNVTKNNKRLSINAFFHTSGYQLKSPSLDEENKAVFFSTDDKILSVSDQMTSLFFPIDLLFPASELSHHHSMYIGQNGDEQLYAIQLPNNTFNLKNFELLPARDVLHKVDDKTAHLVSRGKHLLYWHKSSQFCGSCGALMQFHDTALAKSCLKCEMQIFPTVSPVVMVLVENNGKILLARSPHFAKNTYSILAGFVDPGESCEAAIHREVNEEVGIQVKDITYLGSQAWPFPGSIILGYSAKYAGGEIRIDDEEIEDANWYSVKEMPELPHPYSISRQIIDMYINKLTNSDF